MEKYKTLEEAWNSLLAQCVSEGYKQKIERGSWSNTTTYRKQLPLAIAQIEYPADDFTFNVRGGAQPVTNIATIRRYFEEYLLGTKPPSNNESYTYASRIEKQLQPVMDMLFDTPGTNQASIVVAKEEDVVLNDPACLRLLDFKVHDGVLDLTCVWRSNDLWAAWPTNMGGLALLLQHVAEYARWRVGFLNYVSTGSHIYSYQLEQVREHLRGGWFL